MGELWVKPGDGELGDTNGNFFPVHLFVHLLSHKLGSLCTHVGFTIHIHNLMVMDSSGETQRWHIAILVMYPSICMVMLDYYTTSILESRQVTVNVEFSMHSLQNGSID